MAKARHQEDQEREQLLAQLQSARHTLQFIAGMKEANETTGRISPASRAAHECLAKLADPIKALREQATKTQRLREEDTARLDFLDSLAESGTFSLGFEFYRGPFLQYHNTSSDKQMAGAGYFYLFGGGEPHQMRKLVDSAISKVRNSRARQWTVFLPGQDTAAEKQREEAERRKELAAQKRRDLRSRQKLCGQPI
jgi:hypothetical protein